MASIRDMRQSLRDSSLTELLIPIPPAIFLLITVGVPLGFFLWGSFWTTTPGFGGEFTLTGYVIAFTHPAVHGTLWNTVVLAVVGTGSAIGIGLLTMVYSLKVETRRWLQGTVSAIMIIQLLLPTFIQGLAWKFYLDPMGPINRALMLLPFVDGPVVNSHSIWIIAFIFGTHYAGLVYLLTSGAVKAIPPSLEEVGLISGARKEQVFRHVGIKLILPSLFIAGAIVFARAVSSFGLPLVLGLSDGVYVLATLMYLELGEYPTNFTFIAALGVIILVMSIGLVWLQQTISGAEDRYETLQGSGERTTSMKFEAPRFFKPVFLAFVILVYVLPMGMMVIGSFQKMWVGLNTQFLRWSTEAYVDLFVGTWSSMFYQSLINSLALGTATAVLTLSLAVIISYLSVKTDRTVGTVLSYLSYTPVAIPGIVLASSLQWLLLEYHGVLGFLYGSFSILMIAFATKYLIYGVRSVNSSLRSVGTSLEEASRIAGADLNTTVREIYAPLMKPGLVAGFVIIFIDTTKSLTIPVILGGGGIKIVQSAIWHLISQGDASAAAAYSVILTIGLSVLYGVAYWAGVEITSV